MSSLTRKMKKKMAANSSSASAKAKSKKTTASVTIKLNPKTGLMQEYHTTKGWR